MTETGKKTTGRHVRLAASLDNWLVKRATELGFRSVAELINQLVREEQHRVQQQRS